MRAPNWQSEYIGGGSILTFTLGTAKASGAADGSFDGIEERPNTFNEN
jgi:hypothetical protein